MTIDLLLGKLTIDVSPGGTIRIGFEMTILQPLGNDKHPSCMNRLVGNTDLLPALRLLDFTSSSPRHLRVFTAWLSMSNTSIIKSHSRNSLGMVTLHLCVSTVHVADEVLIQFKHSSAVHRTAALEAFPRICLCP